MNCAHCGEPIEGYSSIRDPASGAERNLCHTDNPDRPDCYRRVTVYCEPIGILAHQYPRPSGVKEIRTQWVKL